MRCPKCDTTIYVKNGFCPSCGSTISEINTSQKKNGTNSFDTKTIDGINTLKGLCIIGCIICIAGLFIPVYVENYLVSAYDNYSWGFSGFSIDEYLSVLFSLAYLIVPVICLLCCVFNRFLLSSLSGFIHGIVYVICIVDMQNVEYRRSNIIVGKHIGFYINIIGIVLMTVSNLISYYKVNKVK